MHFADRQIDRFWASINKKGPVPSHVPELGRCWEWIGQVHPSGYGTFWANDRGMRAHRVALQLAGRDPGRLHVMHHCDNRRCCNPAHLQAVTQAENNADCRAKNRHATGSVVPGPRKLTEQDVVSARARYRRGGIGGPKLKDLAQEYGVSITSMHSALSGKSWAWVGREKDRSLREVPPRPGLGKPRRQRPSGVLYWANSGWRGAVTLPGSRRRKHFVLETKALPEAQAKLRSIVAEFYPGEEVRLAKPAPWLLRLHPHLKQQLGGGR